MMAPLPMRATRVFELVGRGPTTATGTLTASVGDTFNPFTGNGTVTCTDSPTAGPNKGTTTTFTLGADHFEFRNATTSSGAVVPGDTVVPIANVFTNLNSGAWQASSTFSTAGTYYLRYKATDAAGNDTPNDADHYLTVTVEGPVFNLTSTINSQQTYDITDVPSEHH